MAHTYLISTHPARDFEDRIRFVLGEERAAKIQVEWLAADEVEVAAFPESETALKVYKFVIYRSEKYPESDSYWHYRLLDENAFLEFKTLNKSQLFGLLEMSKVNVPELKLNDFGLTYQFRGMNGTVMKAEQRAYSSAIDFWVNAIQKLQLDQLDVSVDLYGGSYNPVSVSSMENTISSACGVLSSYLDPDTVVSVIDINHGSRGTACFFVETQQEYFVIDLCCP